MRETALDILRDKLQYSLLTEDLELLEKAFFILRSQLYRDSHCLNSSVQERYGKSMEKLAFIYVCIYFQNGFNVEKNESDI